MESGQWAPGKGNDKTTFAIASDLSCVIPTHDGFGIFTTEEEALDALISKLEAERADVANKIASAKARRRALRRK